MRDIFIGITAASYSGNKGAAAMLQSSITQLYKKYGDRLNINLMSVYPEEDKKQPHERDRGQYACGRASYRCCASEEDR